MTLRSTVRPYIRASGALEPRTCMHAHARPPETKKKEGHENQCGRVSERQPTKAKRGRGGDQNGNTVDERTEYTEVARLTRKLPCPGPRS